MYTNLGFIWSIFPAYLEQTLHQLKSAIDAGPVDDATRSGLAIQKAGSTAIVSMRGTMIKEAGFLSYYGFAGSRETGQALESAANDDDIKSILWMVDSAGGSVDGLDELATTVKQVASEKPVHVQVDGLMASAAVYVTANATTIHANKRDLVGSIGTRMMMYDFSEMFKNDGIKPIPIDTGEHKSSGAMGTEITESQQAEFQRIVDGYFSDFMGELLSGRGMVLKELKSMADGRVFFANEEPIQSGLIDGIRSTKDALSSAHRKDGEDATANARIRMLSI